MRYVVGLITVCVAAIFGMPDYGWADETQPSGRVVLKIQGSDASSDGKNYDLEMIQTLGMQDVVTETPWTEGLVRFSGVLVRDLLRDAGFAGTQITATALNDYAVNIPITDFQKYDVILATQRDSTTLTIRDRGPIWVIYPWTANKELQNELYYSRSIWQLVEIKVH